MKPLGRLPGWLALSKMGIEVAALAAADRLLEPRKPRVETAPARTPSPPTAQPADEPSGAPAIPAFIGEVTDNAAKVYRTRVANGFLFVGVYSDGRIRMATPSGRRFSGFIADGKAVMADLREDVSFEMILDENADTQLMLTMDGGPFAGRSLRCERMP